MIDLQELADQPAELLPTREALGNFNLSNVAAVNLALAINLGDGEAEATADQAIDVGQG